MSTYPMFGSTQLDPRISGEAAPSEVGIVDELSRGYRRGLRGAGSSLAELAGAGAEALGATEVASGARRVAGSLREAAGAPELAPSVRSIRDVDSVGSGLRWGAGMMGEMTPVLAAAVAGGALTKNPMVGGTIAMAPFEAGDIASRQDKTQGTAGSRLAEAAGGGLASAVVGNVLPTRIMGKFGKGLRGDSSFLPAMGKNIAEGAGVGAVSEAGNEGVKQFASRQEFDTEAITETGLGGAAFGGAFGVPAGVASYAKGNAESIGKTATALKDKGMELGGKIKDKAQSKLEDEGIDLGAAFDKGTDLVKRGRTKVDDAVDRVINGQPLGDTLKEFATATGDRAKEIMDLSAEEKGKKVREWATKMADDAGFNADKREAVIQAAQKTGDRAAEITIATAKKAYDAAKRAREQLKEFANSFPASMENGKLKAGEHPASFNHDSIIDVEARKKSEDMSGPKKVVLEALRESGLMESRPDLFDHSDNINMLASTLSKTMQQLAKGPLSTKQMEKLTRVLGDDTMPTLSALRRAVLGDADTENFFKNVGAISDAQRTTSKLDKQLRTLLTPEATENYQKLGFSLGELQDYFVDDYNRNTGGKGTFGNIAMGKQSEDAYATFFGPKADAAKALIEKHAKTAFKDSAQLDKLPESAKLLKKPAKPGREDGVETDRLDEAGNLVEASEGGFDEAGRRVEAEQTKVMMFGLGAKRTDGGRRSVLNGESYDLPEMEPNATPEAYQAEPAYRRLAQHISDLKVRYPQHSVRFDSETGTILVEKSVADGTLTDDVEAAMRLDTKKYANSPSALKIGDKSYDAMRVTRLTRKSMKKEDGERADIQLARAFHEGVAALIERHGAANVDIPDSTLIGSINGVKMTAGQAKALKPRLTREDRIARNLDEAIVDLRVQYKEAKAKGEDVSEILEEYKDKVAEREALKLEIQTRENNRPDSGSDDKVDTGTRQAGKGDNIHAAAKDNKGEALVNRSNMAGQPHSAPNVTRTGDENVRKNTLSDAIAKWEEQVTTEPGRRLVARARVLYENIDIMSANDRQRFYDTGTNKPETSEGPARASRARDALEVVNTLAKKYAKQIEGRTKWNPIDNDVRSKLNPTVERAGPTKDKPGAVGERPAGSRGEFSATPDIAARGARRKQAEDAFLGRGPRSDVDNPDVIGPEFEAAIQKLLDKRNAVPNEKQLLAQLEYLNNPPADYTTAQARKIVADARQFLTRGDEDARTLLRQIIKKGESVLDGDASLETLEGRPDPKVVAAKKAAFLERAASGDEGLIRELRTTDDAKGLQRALAVLPDGAARDAAMQRMSELVKDDSVAYQLQTRKYSLVGVGIHNDLNKPGFPATHDSPIRHEGKFDWRKHKGKGEGNAAFGAGTYLSTADGVHKSYKNQFSGGNAKTEYLRRALEEVNESLQDNPSKLTAKEIREFVEENLREYLDGSDGWLDLEIADALQELKSMSDESLTRGKSPTYEVSVNIEPHQILDWDKPLREQPQEVRDAVKAAYKALGVNTDPVKMWDGNAIARARITTNAEGNVYSVALTDGWEMQAKLVKGFLGEKDGKAATMRADMWSVRLYKDGQLVPKTGRYGPLTGSSGLESVDSLLRSLAQTNKWYDQLVADVDAKTGSTVYRSLQDWYKSQEAASDALQAVGILGHKFNAAGGKNDRHPNYVIYDDSKIETNYVHFSQGRVDPNATGPINKQAVEEHIEKVLGKSVRTFWPTFSIMPWAGDYTHVQKLIRISVQSLNPMSVAYHESMHAFVANLRDMGATDVVAALEKAANSPHNITQVREFFKNEPEVLKQLSDPEERVAYMYQLWAAGQLTPSPGARTVFQKIAAFFRKILGQWSNDQRAEHIMEYFNSGEYAKGMASPNAVRRALMAPGRNKAYETAAGFTKGLADLADTLFTTGSARVRETGVPALQDIADAVKRQGKDTRGGTRGFVQASRLAATKLRSEFASRLDEHVTSDHLREAIEALQTNARAPSPEARNTVRAVRAQLKEARQYMLDAGAYVGDLGPEYFPRVWDIHYISKNQKAFRDMLEPYVRSGALKGDVDKLIKKLVASEGHEFSVETDMPGMQFTKQRVLGFISDADAAGFLEKDLMETMHSYLTQAARRAEWFRLFGNGKLDALLSRARKEGATKEQIETTEQYLKGINGTLGDNISPALRRLYGNTIVYQNVRLLPLAVFSSLVDPMGIVVRGGTVRDAWSTFTKGIREIPGSFRKKSQKPGQAEEIAELVGVIDSAMLNHITSDMYTQGMVGGTAKKINNAFFKYNLMEGLNRSYRVGATAAALKFIAKHADGTASRHSQRWIKELGLDPSDVKVYQDRIALTQAEGLSPEAEVRLHAAINQWVDGAILRPDAADKPIWMNDPHYAIFSHLKQFIYSFQKTIIERTVHEFKNGNYTPAMALASYVPMMIASDFIKGMIQGGGSQPDWKKDWGPVEYVGYGVQRAGLLSVGQFGVDAYENMSRGGLGVTALGGPAIEQLVDVLGTLSGRNQFGDVALDALPANALYSEAIGPGR